MIPRGGFKKECIPDVKDGFCEFAVCVCVTHQNVKLMITRTRHSLRVSISFWLLFSVNLHRISFSCKLVCMKITEQSQEELLAVLEKNAFEWCKAVSGATQTALI